MSHASFTHLFCKTLKIFFSCLILLILLILSPRSSHALPECYADGPSYAQTVAQEVCQGALDSVSHPIVFCSKGGPPVDFSVVTVQYCVSKLVPLILSNINIYCSTGNPKCVGPMPGICDVTPGRLDEFKKLEPVTAMVDYCQCGNAKLDFGEDCDLSFDPKSACTQDCRQLFIWAGPLTPLQLPQPDPGTGPTQPGSPPEAQEPPEPLGGTHGAPAEKVEEEAGACSLGSVYDSSSKFLFLLWGCVGLFGYRFLKRDSQKKTALGL